MEYDSSSTGSLKLPKPVPTGSLGGSISVSPKSSIFIALDDLMGSYESLDSAVAELDNKLIPVSSNPGENSPVEAPDPPYNCEVECRILAIAISIRRLTKKLNHMNSCIQL